MPKDAQHLVDEALRDISTATAELKGRADQAVADFEERIAQLESLGRQLESGEISARVTQDRVRQLLRERGGIARPTRAGRTQIGMRSASPDAPKAPTAPPVATRNGPTSTLAAAAITKTQAIVDSRVVSVLVAQGFRRDEARLELSLLAHLRRGLDLMAADMPQDAVLIEGVMEFADDAQTVVADLDAGGPVRLKRLIDYLRELIGQIAASGATVGELREQVKRLRTAAEAPGADPKRVLGETAALFARLAPESDRRLPIKERTLFDDLLRVG